MTACLGQLERAVEPERVKALYRAGIGITNCRGAARFQFVRVELLESAT